MRIAPRWIKVYRDLWRNKLRTALVVMAVATGVFAFGMMGNAGSSMLSELTHAYMATNPPSFTMNMSPFDDNLVRAVRGMREVGAAEGRAMQAVSLQIGPDEWITLEVVALRDFDAMQLALFFPEQGTWPPARQEILLERSITDIPGYELGDSIHVELPDGQERDLRVAGLVHDVAKFPTQYFNTAYGYITLDTMEWLTGSREYNQLHVMVKEHPTDLAHIQQVAGDIRERVERDGYAVSTTLIPEPGMHWNMSSMEAMVLILGVVGGFSLFLSAFLVINTVTAILTQQTRQIGMMKAIGGERRQITPIYLAQVMVFGVLALLIAVPVGVIGGRGFTEFAAVMGNFDVTGLHVEPGVIAVQSALAILTPLIAALWPVLRGTAITAREAISDYGITQPQLKRDVVDILIENVRGLPRPLLLSLRNTFRRKARLSLTVITLTLAGSIFISVFSVRQSLETEFSKIFGLFNFDVGVLLGEPVHPRRAEREAQRVEGVVSAEAWNVTRAQFVREDGSEGPLLRVYAITPGTSYVIPYIDEGRWLSGEDYGSIAIADNTLSIAEPGFALGNTITLKFGAREDQWTVIGRLPVINDPSGDFVAYITTEAYHRVVGGAGTSNYVVFETAEHSTAYQYQVAREISEDFKQSGLVVAQTFAIGQLIGTALTIIQVMIAFLLMMAALLAIVGALSLMGTMSLNVLERTREIGVMRAIGASNRAVWGLVIVEGVLIGVLSAALGALAALPVSKVLLTMVGVAFMGKPLDYAYSLPGAAMWVALSALIAAAASFFPARNAARITVREALAYE